MNRSTPSATQIIIESSDLTGQVHFSLIPTGHTALMSCMRERPVRTPAHEPPCTSQAPVPPNSSHALAVASGVNPSVSRTTRTRTARARMASTSAVTSSAKRRPPPSALSRSTLATTPMSLAPSAASRRDSAINTLVESDSTPPLRHPGMVTRRRTCRPSAVPPRARPRAGQSHWIARGERREHIQRATSVVSAPRYRGGAQALPPPRRHSGSVAPS